jgi:molybdate transport system substrate-binding protein
VHLSFDGSSALATQILEGASADVFASADVVNMDKVEDAGLHAGLVEPFAVNGLQIAVPRGNPARVTSLADLAERDLTVALCAPEVPCGAYATEAFAQAGLPRPDASQEENVRGVLTKVALGEADAGIVYATDVLANDEVEGIDLPAEAQVLAFYPAVALADAPNSGAAAAFIAFLTSIRAQDILGAHGFGPPPR